MFVFCGLTDWCQRGDENEKQDLFWRKFQMNSLHPISQRWWYLHEGGNATRWRRFLRKSVLPRHDVNVKRYQLAGLLFWSFEYCWVLLEHCWLNSFECCWDLLDLLYSITGQYCCKLLKFSAHSFEVLGIRYLICLNISYTWERTPFDVKDIWKWPSTM